MTSAQHSRAIAAVFTFPNSSVEVYDRRLVEYGDELRDQPGRLSHVCFKTSDGYTVVDVWESLEAFEKFGEVIGRIQQEMGSGGHGSFEVGRVEIHPVHNLL